MGCAARSRAPWPGRRFAPSAPIAAPARSGMLNRRMHRLAAQASLTVHKQHLVPGALGSCDLREHALQPTVAPGRATWTTRP